MTADELLKLAAELEAKGSRRGENDFSEPLQRMEKAAEEVDKAWSRSWLGSQACVYYEDFARPPAGHRFSREWGFVDPLLSEETIGNWREYTPDSVVNTIFEKAGNPDLQSLGSEANLAREFFDEAKATILSTLSIALTDRPDKVLQGLCDRIEETRVYGPGYFISEWQPRGEISSHDIAALEQGVQVPPHLRILASVNAIGQAFAACLELGKLTRRAGSHLNNLKHRERPGERTGTKAVIDRGHTNNEPESRPKVFICYAKEDETIARRLYHSLEAAGVEPWLDKEKLVLGDDWELEIKQSVSAADAFVACLRPGFDEIGFRQREIHWALEALEKRPKGRGFIIPYIIEPCNLPVWCEEIHAGQLSDPTPLEDLLKAIEKHARMQQPLLRRDEHGRLIGSPSWRAAQVPDLHGAPEATVVPKPEETTAAQKAGTPAEIAKRTPLLGLPAEEAATTLGRGAPSSTRTVKRLILIAVVMSVVVILVVLATRDTRKAERTEPEKPKEISTLETELRQEDLRPEVITRIVLKGDWPERRALAKLYKSGNRDSQKAIADTLIQLTESPDPETVYAAISSLAVGDWFFDVLNSEDSMRIAARLASFSGSSSADIRYAVASVFDLGVDEEKVIPVAFSFMSRLARDPDKKVRKEALRNLGNLSSEAHRDISDEIWRILDSAWRNEVTEVRAEALAGFQDFRYDEDEERKRQLSKIILDGLESRESVINQSALWVLGGLGGDFKPPDSYNDKILAALLKLYRIDRSNPRSWYIDAFENLRGELPAWAEERLEKDKRAEKEWREEEQRLRQRIEQEKKSPPV